MPWISNIILITRVSYVSELIFLLNCFFSGEGGPRILFIFCILFFGLLLIIKINIFLKHEDKYSLPSMGIFFNSYCGMNPNSGGRLPSDFGSQRRWPTAVRGTVIPIIHNPITLREGMSQRLNTTQRIQSRAECLNIYDHFSSYLSTELRRVEVLQRGSFKFVQYDDTCSHSVLFRIHKNRIYINSSIL